MNISLSGTLNPTTTMNIHADMHYKKRMVDCLALQYKSASLVYYLYCCTSPYSVIKYLNTAAKMRLVIILSCLVGFGYAWNLPNSCFVKQSSCSSGVEELRNIQETLSGMANSLNRLVGETDSSFTIRP